MDDKWTCPRCKKEFIPILTDEDRIDGCADGITLCDDCVDKHFDENFDISKLVRIN